MRGGAPLHWLKPLLPDGTREVGVKGTYSGQFEHWNIEGLRPGFVPRYVSKRKYASRLRRGYVVAKPEDCKPFGGIPTAHQTGTGSAMETENLILMLAPIEVVEREQAALAEKNRQWTNTPSSDYIGRGTSEEARYSEVSKRPIRFVE